MKTTSGWCDTTIQYEVLQVLPAVLKKTVTSRDMPDMIKKQFIDYLDLYYLSNFAICKLLFGMTRCAGY